MSWLITITYSKILIYQMIQFIVSQCINWHMSFNYFLTCCHKLPQKHKITFCRNKTLYIYPDVFVKSKSSKNLAVFPEFPTLRWHTGTGHYLYTAPAKGWQISPEIREKTSHKHNQSFFRPLKQSSTLSTPLHLYSCALHRPETNSTASTPLVILANLNEVFRNRTWSGTSRGINRSGM